MWGLYTRAPFSSAWQVGGLVLFVVLTAYIKPWWAKPRAAHKNFHLLWFFFTSSCFRKGMCTVILWCLYLAFPKNKYVSLFLTEHSIFPSIQCIQRSWWLEELLGNWTDTLFPWPKLTCFKRRNGNMWWEDLEHGPECCDGSGSSQS